MLIYCPNRQMWALVKDPGKFILIALQIWPNFSNRLRCFCLGRFITLWQSRKPAEKTQRCQGTSFGKYHDDVSRRALLIRQVDNVARVDSKDAVTYIHEAG